MNLFLVPWELSLVLVLVGFVLVIAYLWARRQRPRVAPELRLSAAVLLGLGGVLLVAALALGIPLDFTGAPVVTSPTAPPLLRSRVYTVAPANDIYGEAIRTADSLGSWGRRWAVVSQRSTPISGGQFQVAVPGLFWTDTLVAAVRPEEGGVQVDVQARSPLGVLALGAPRREIAQFLTALDARIAAR